MDDDDDDDVLDGEPIRRRNWWSVPRVGCNDLNPGCDKSRHQMILKQGLPYREATAAC